MINTTSKLTFAFMNESIRNVSKILSDSKVAELKARAEAFKASLVTLNIEAERELLIKSKKSICNQIDRKIANLEETKDAK